MAIGSKVTVLLALVGILVGPASSPVDADNGSNHLGLADRLIEAASVACRGLAAERGVLCQPLEAEVRPLVPGIAYFRFLVRVGPGARDVIAIHRVISEHQLDHPEQSSRALFMIHGDLWGFTPAFLGLTAYTPPREVSLPVYLARHDVDVWGISLRWAQVPVGFPDLSIMENWGLDAAVSDARIALRIARIVRQVAGQDERIHVLGWSRGMWTTVALANAEATESPQLRDIGGLIPVEGAFKVDPANEAFRQFWCSNYDFYQNLLAAGTFGLTDAFVQNIGRLALEAPDDPSPYRPGLTNAQYAMGVGSWPAQWPGLEWYHFTAGTFDEAGEPTGLVYTDPTLFFVELTKVFGYEPVLYLSDTSAVACDAIDVPWDDDLAAVHNPVLYVGAGGGFGDAGTYTIQRLGSEDVTILVVREQPPDRAELDIGHADVFESPASRQLFWEPILEWIQAH